MKRLIVAALIVTFTLTGAATVASAGEITGSGKPTPIKLRQSFPDHPQDRRTASAAFSGLNDGYIEGTEPTRTQSWGSDGPSTVGGQEVKLFATSGLIKEIGPGTACRGGQFPEE